MQSPSPTWKLWTAFAAVLLFTVGGMTADRLQALSGFRTAAHDFLSPGRLLVVSLFGDQSVHASSANARALPEVAALEQQLQTLESQRRQLLIENARLHNQLRLAARVPDDSHVGGRLAGFQVIPARILSRHGMPPSLQQLFIDVGRAHGMKRSELVLDGHGILVDEGTQAGVDSGHQVLLGRTVFGRIARAGRWVSQVQPVTDSGFSARVRLTRASSHGSAGNTEGLLEGTGTGCRITGVPYTESVAVGDEVFSADLNGINGPRLYFGTVVTAQFESGGEWTVLVDAAASAADVSSVTVVCPTLNAVKINSAEIDVASVARVRP